MVPELEAALSWMILLFVIDSSRGILYGLVNGYNFCYYYLIGGLDDWGIGFYWF